MHAHNHSIDGASRSLTESHRPLNLMLVAGEASGDKHGAALAEALTRLSPQSRLFGAGGREMRNAGVETIVDSASLAIMGVPEIARALPKFIRAYRKLVKAAQVRRPHAIVLIDWPDFNLRLASRLHREGLKIIYYISPQVWAWRKYRVRTLRRTIERILVILPFEQEFYRREGIDATYVGHPLARSVRTTASRNQFCAVHRLDPARPFISLLPGSRHKEVVHHLPVMLDSAKLLRDRVDWAPYSNSGLNRGGSAPTPEFLIPLATTIAREDIDRVAPLPDGFRVLEGDTYNALGHSEFAVVASGTATVEAALLGVPMVIIYRGSELNWRLIRPLIKLDTFGMVNLIAQRRVVPELIQHDATAENIARQAASILADADRIAEMKRSLAAVSALLSQTTGSPPENAARAVLQVADGM